MNVKHDQVLICIASQLGDLMQAVRHCDHNLSKLLKAKIMDKANSTKEISNQHQHLPFQPEALNKQRAQE